MKPKMFVSAVSQEFGESRVKISLALQVKGWEPVFQDTFQLGSGVLKAKLQEKIDQCEGFMQLVGWTSGCKLTPSPESELDNTLSTRLCVVFSHVCQRACSLIFRKADLPVDSQTPDEQLSCTQYEYNYARKKGKNCWILLATDKYGTYKERDEGQLQYRERIMRSGVMYYDVSNCSEAEWCIARLPGGSDFSWRWMLTVSGRQIGCSFGVMILTAIIAIAGVALNLHVMFSDQSDYMAASQRFLIQIADRHESNEEYSASKSSYLVALDVEEKLLSTASTTYDMHRHAIILTKLGDLSVRDRDFTGVIKYFSRALKLPAEAIDATRPLILIRLGCAYDQRGDLARAKSTLRDAELAMIGSELLRDRDLQGAKYRVKLEMTKLLLFTFEEKNYLSLYFRDELESRALLPCQVLSTEIMRGVISTFDIANDLDCKLLRGANGSAIARVYNELDAAIVKTRYKQEFRAIFAGHND